LIEAKIGLGPVRVGPRNHRGIGVRRRADDLVQSHEPHETIARFKLRDASPEMFRGVRVCARILGEMATAIRRAHAKTLSVPERAPTIIQPLCCRMPGAAPVGTAGKRVSFTRTAIRWMTLLWGAGMRMTEASAKLNGQLRATPRVRQ
jgi:hypothetical protein